MKIMMAYPPLPSEKGIPLLAQNRQFQWFKNPTYIYPMVPAYAATMLKEAGFEVFWEDGIAEGLSEDAWRNRFLDIQPDVVVLESKTPVIRRHWRLIQSYKDIHPSLITVLVGDHVTARPRESMDECPVDFVITGGDYDFTLTELCCALSSGSSPASYPSGVWYRTGDGIHNTGPFSVRRSLDLLPRIDRDLTKWQLYARHNGNYKYTPGTYVMAGRDCWWGRCRFCSWTTLYPAGTYRTVPVEKHLDEIGYLIDRYPVKEIFDDSGCFPKGEWLRAFCRGMVDRGYAGRIALGCNMRVGGLDEGDCRLMKQAGFRFLLIGLESVCQSTLDRLDKGVRVDDIAAMCRMAKQAGMEPHVTIMVGYPWETQREAEETIAFARNLFRKGYIDTLQATIVVPYPGTPLFDEAEKAGWLSAATWDDFDMKRSVWQSPVSPEDLQGFVRSLYRSALSPRFLFRKLSSVRSMDDAAYLLRAGRKLWGHVRDFAGRRHAGARS